LRVGAAIGVFDFDRAQNLIAKDVDVLILDSAHGHSANVIETVKEIKRRWDIDVVAGNVATKEGCSDLIALVRMLSKSALVPARFARRASFPVSEFPGHGDLPAAQAARTPEFRSSPMEEFATRVKLRKRSLPARTR